MLVDRLSNIYFFDDEYIIYTDGYSKLFLLYTLRIFENDQDPEKLRKLRKSKKCFK